MKKSNLKVVKSSIDPPALPTFGYVDMNDEQRQACVDLDEAFTSLHNHITRILPFCRRRSIALNYLEEAAMWANKSVSRDWEKK